MVDAETAWALLLFFHLIILVVFIILIWKNVWWFETNPEPRLKSERQALQAMANSALTFWLGIIALLVATLALKDLDDFPVLRSLLIALAINVVISGIPALVPLASGLFKEIKNTKKVSLIKPLALSWLLLACCLMEIAIVAAYSLSVE